jgi:integrase
MGTVYRPTVTRPMPTGAKVERKGGNSFAVWTDRRGKRRRAQMVGGGAKRPGIAERAGTYTAKYRDADGSVRCVATGCRSLDTAKARLAELEAQVERVKAGILTHAEVGIAAHVTTPVEEHIEAYITHLSGKRGRGARRAVSPAHVKNVRHCLSLAVQECGFKRLRDLSRDAADRWVARLLDLPEPVDGKDVTGCRPAARTINARLVALTAWGNWLVEAGRLGTNPFARLRKLDENEDRRRNRRSLTEDELRRLLLVAANRPVAELGRSTLRVIDADLPPKSRATWRKASLTVETILAAAERGRGQARPGVVQARERMGRERALLYKVLVTTGLRKKELASIVLRDVELQGPHPGLLLRGADSKAGQRAFLPLREDVAADLRAWLADRAAWRREADSIDGGPLPAEDEALFYVPSGLIRILDRDLAAAGIPKRDERGWSVDVHAMRHTFASHLAAANVPPRIAQAAMRHSSLDLTMKVYTDPRMLDVEGAIRQLPFLRGEDCRTEGACSKCTNNSVAPDVAPTTGQHGATLSLLSITQETPGAATQTKAPKKTPISRVIPAQEKERAKGLEPSTSSLGS